MFKLTQVRFQSSIHYTDNGPTDKLRIDEPTGLLVSTKQQVQPGDIVVLTSKDKPEPFIVVEAEPLERLKGLVDMWAGVAERLVKQ